MASLKEDKINFEKLSAGANRAIVAENLYWLRNDAKFRAVAQKGTYDEFKEIVAAAHLKPLDKTDKLQICDERPSCPWNYAAPNNINNIQKSPDLSQDSPLIDKTSKPTTSNMFVKQWRLLKASQDKVEYMNALEPSEFTSLFKKDIPFGLLGEFVTLMNTNVHLLGLEKCAAILTSLQSIDRFKLTLSFLSSSERQQLDDILQRLTAMGIETSELLSSYKQ